MWTLTMRRFLCVALVAAGCTVGGPSEPAAAPASPVRGSAGSPFGAGCAVPGASPGSAVEPDLAVAPGDARHLVAVWQQDRVVRGAALANLVATSRDGGRSWRSRPLPHLTRCSGSPSWTLASDPWVSIGSGGVVYASSLLITPGSPLRSALAVSVSADGGDHWADPVVVQTSADEQIDKPQLLADPRARGVAYAVWVSYPRGQDAGRNRVWLAHTTDAGHSWSGPRVIRDAGLEDQFNQ